MEIEIYGRGMVYCSVCTDSTDRPAIELKVNLQNPTGIQSRWEIADENFNSGESNPCPCPDHEGKQHYLMVC